MTLPFPRSFCKRAGIPARYTFCMSAANQQPRAPWGASAQPVNSAENDPAPADPYSSSPLDYSVPPPGNYYQQPGYQGYPRFVPQIQPHRAETLKLLAILGFFMWIVALIALLLANQDLAAIQTGKMDAAGYAETQNAKGLAKIALIVHACLMVFGLIMWFAMMSVFVLRTHP